MTKTPAEDLFSDTTMTFGEHLEELRVCLVRALMGLGIGMLVGLFLADTVVIWIQVPLIRALKQHYSIMAEERLETLWGGEVSAEVTAMAVEQGYTFEVVYFEREELDWLLGQTTGEASEAPTGTADPAVAMPGEGEREMSPPTTDLIKTRIWRTAEAKLTTLSPHEMFMIWLKAGFVTGLILASPYIFYQIWLFVAAGLFQHERRFVYFFLPFSLLLFLAGAAMAFFFVFGPVLEFLFSFSRWMNIDPDLRISEVIGFVLVLPLGFGIAFQLPLVMLFANRIGVVSVAAYLEKWRVAILVIFVISMLLTPADPVSMLLMAVPLTVLYFLGIALCHWLPRNRNPFGETYEPA
jgi:sec-independent protein translocase protein TatC